MGSELNIKVTEQELKYRLRNYSDIRAIELRQLSCCSCGNVLSQQSGRVYSHPIFGIFQCENCKDYFKTVTFRLDKYNSVRFCHICGREDKNSYECKTQDCPYEVCKRCIKRNIPNSLVDAESGKWKCFACNTQPLWKLRGACAAVMNSLSQRTKTKKVKSRNRSSDSEDNTTDLRHISYVRRSRSNQAKELSKRLQDVCDPESPIQPDEPQLVIPGQNKRAQPGHGNSTTKIDVKHARVDTSLQLHKDLETSSEDSDLEEIQIFKPKTFVKSQSKRKERSSKNGRVLMQRKSRYQKPSACKSVLKVDSDSSSVENNNVGKTKHCRKSKLHRDNNSSNGKRRKHTSTSASRQSSENETKISNSRNNGGSRETMPSTRESKIYKKYAQGRGKVSSRSEIASESDSSSDDSDTKTIKSLMPSLFIKGKSGDEKKSIQSRRRKESSEDEEKISRTKSKGDSKSLASKAFNISSESSNTDSESLDTIAEDDIAWKNAKKSSVISPGPKSFKEGKKPRREISPHSDGDSGRSVTTRSIRNDQKRISVATHSDSDIAEDRGSEKSIRPQLLKNRKQTSDSSSGKEFKKSNLLRPSFVTLQRIRNIEKDLTTSPKESSRHEEASSTITKDQTFALKNSVNNFFSEMKIAATKLLNNIENVQKTYSMKDSMRVEEANFMVLESKNVVAEFRDIVDKSDSKVTDYYHKWCKKTKVKNVLRKHATDEKMPSTSKPSASKTAKTAEESGGASSNSTKNVSSVKEARAKSRESTIANGENNVLVSEYDRGETFSAPDKSRMLMNKSSFASLVKNGKDENIDVSKERESKRSSRDATPDESEQFAVSSDKEPSDIEDKLQSPTMSEFSGCSDRVENLAESGCKLQCKTMLSGIQEDVKGMDRLSDSTKDIFDLSADMRILNETSDFEKVKYKAEGEKSSSSVPKIRKTRKIQSKITVSRSDSESDCSTRAKDSLSKAPPWVLPEQSESEAPATEKLMAITADDKDKNSEEILNLKEKDPAKITDKIVDQATALTEAEKSERAGEDPLVEEKEQSEEESNRSCDIASASTELLSCSPEKSSDEKDGENDNHRSTIPVSNDAGFKDKTLKNEKETVAEKYAGIPNDPSGAKQPKKANSTRRSDSVRRSSLDMVLDDGVENTTNKKTSSKAPTENDSSASTDISESQNARAREALLISSNSEDSTSDERESTAQSTPKGSNDTPPTPPESDSKSEKNSVSKDSAERDSSENPRKKRSKFHLNENCHYIADELLKRKCEIRVERMKETILSRYSRALRESRDYVESKNLKRLVALNNLDKDHKKVCDEDKSSKDLKRKAQAAKETEHTLLDHLKKVENDENSKLSNESDAQSSTTGNKKKAKYKSEDRLLAEANRMAKKRLLESSDSGADEQPVSDAKNEDSKKTEKVVMKGKLDKFSADEEKRQEKSDKNRWRRNKILTLKISDSDSEAECKKFDLSQEKLKEKEKKQGSQSESDEEASSKKKKKRARRRVLHSDSDIKLSSEKSDSDSDNWVQSNKKKKKKKSESSDEEKDKKQTRKRTRRGRRSSDSSSSIDERPKPSRRKRIKTTGSDSDSENDLDSSQGTPGKSGRKNIRKVLRDKQVAQDTKQAAKEEEERLKRIAERQKLYNEMYEVRLAGEERVEKLVLDFNEETKEPLVSVEEGLVKRLKPHQAQGIKFMWDACFESLERSKSTKGSGCILAHCMGLGKSFQVVTLAHTLITHRETGINTVLVVCPLSTVLNWVNEFKIWLADINDGDDIEIYEMTKMKKNFERKYQLSRWQETGGVMIIGYEMFRNLSQQTGRKVRKNIQETFLKCLVDPGPDFIVCDEGHLLKNEDTALSKAMRRVKTLRRVVLTGTPLQNNLIEYHCMVQFVKPNLLGTKKEFMNRFENPITNGQFDDSTEYDVKLMKKRAHVLHKMLEGSVQRFDYSVLTPFLPPKQEYVIFVKLTEIQIKMYRHYLDNYARKHRGVGGSLFADFQALQRIWTHPMVMQMNAEKVERANEKKRLDASDSEGSLRDFIDDGSDTPCTTNSSDDGSEDEKKKLKRGTRANPVEEPIEEVAVAPEDAFTTDETQWWTQYVKEEDYEDIRCSSKLLILFRILKESEQIGDKVLVFSQSLYSLTLIEKCLELIDEETQKGNEPENLDGLSGSWALGLDYFRLDGQTSTDNRRRWCDIFNKPSNTRARLFLISTRAGGLGINLTAANRVVIFDASWNPSHDVQSIFRIYRFGQKKPCYVYRLLAAGTMEEKIYNRQVTKLSLSCRVVDEQQIERHYSNNALAELYKLELPSETETTLNLPRDRLLAEIFLKYKHAVENYHEHDSLLENQAGEELDEEERQQAWLEYEEEKKGKRMMPPVPFANYQDQLLMQQINMVNMGQQNAINNPAMFADYQNLQRLIEKDYPRYPETQQKIMTSRAVYEMYNYVEKQAMASQGAMHLPNLGALHGAYNNQIAQAVNPAQTYMDILRMHQQQTLGQQQNGQIKFANNQQQLRADMLRQQQQIQYAQQSQVQGQSSSPSITIDDDDIMEVPSSPNKNPVPPVPDTSRKNKEE